MTKTEKVIKALELEIQYPQGWACRNECPYYGKTECDCFTQASKDALELLKARQWISVKDRLPEVDQSVIVFARGKNDPIYKIAIASMSNKNIFSIRLETELYWREPWQFFNTMYEITHWMPLPEPPEESKRQMNNWRDDDVTEKQLAYILEMREHSEYSLPEFTGTTKGEAADYINKWTKLAHESRWAIEHGY